MLYMFRTVLVHLQEQSFYKLLIAGTIRLAVVTLWICNLEVFDLILWVFIDLDGNYLLCPDECLESVLQLDGLNLLNYSIAIIKNRFCIRYLMLSGRYFCGKSQWGKVRCVTW